MATSKDPRNLAKEIQDDKDYEAFLDRLNSIPRSKYIDVYKSPAKWADAIKLNRKVYENFYPYPTSFPVDPNNPGGSPDVVGADRVYALYQHALDNNLDFGRVLANDRQFFPDRTPNVLEFKDNRFELEPGSLRGKHFGRGNGKMYDPKSTQWTEISTGTNYGKDIFDLLSKENFK